MDLTETYLAGLAGVASPEETARLDETVARERQTIIADCMAKRGFHYRQRAVGIDPRIKKADFNYKSETYTKEFGFGIVANFQLASNGVFANAENATANEDLPQVGPEREAYMSALQKDSAASKSCGSSATEQVRSRYGFDHLSETYTQREVSVLTSAAYLDAQETWQQCVKAAGYSFDSLKAMLSHFGSEVSKLTNDQSGNFAKVDPMKTDKIRKDEIGTASATFKCNVRFLDSSGQIFLAALKDG
jgi:hypothetical protein